MNPFGNSIHEKYSSIIYAHLFLNKMVRESKRFNFWVYYVLEDFPVLYFSGRRFNNFRNVEMKKYIYNEKIYFLSDIRYNLEFRFNRNIFSCNFNYFLDVIYESIQFYF